MYIVNATYCTNASHKREMKRMDWRKEDDKEKEEEAVAAVTATAWKWNNLTTTSNMLAAMRPNRKIITIFGEYE